MRIVERCRRVEQPGSYEETKEVIQYGEIIRDNDMNEATSENHLLGDTIFDNVEKVDNALRTIKIADPAVGSGAFPLGILNEIVKLRDIITLHMLIIDILLEQVIFIVYFTNLQINY